MRQDSKRFLTILLKSDFYFAAKPLWYYIAQSLDQMVTNNDITDTGFDDA